jgi:predicted RNA-binding protein YlxR (DUF448 family)
LTKMKSTNPAPAKHIPQRTCVACGGVKPKRELVRLVKVSGGGVEVDPAGRKAGRGAYLCPTPDCWQTGLKKGRLEYVLRTTLTEDNRQQLIRYGKELG